MSWLSDNLPPEILSSSLMVFNVTLPDGQVVPLNMAKEIEVTSEDFVSELKQVSAQYAFYAAVYSELKTACTIQEKRVKQRRASALNDTIRIGKKLTDKQSQILWEADEEVVKAELKLSIMQKQTGKVYHMLEALKIKSESMRSLTGIFRNEYYLAKDQT